MYLRWKTRAVLRRGRPAGRQSLRAVLVESRRVGGKPRQRVVKYLGTITSDAVRHTGARLHFRRRVAEALQGLGLPDGHRRLIELAIHERVPFPTGAEVRAAQEEFARCEARIANAL